MKIEIKDLPIIPERNGRKVVETTLEDLKNAGIAFASFGLQEGDTIEFPELNDIQVRKQAVRENSNAQQYLLGVLRNSKASWLSTGSLRRTAKDMAPSCDFVKKMNSSEFNDDLDRIKFLAGKKIKVTSMKEMETFKFDNNGVRLQETEMRKFPVIELA